MDRILSTDGSAGTQLKETGQAQILYAQLWNVFLWDDPVNNQAYVVFVLQRVFGFPQALAAKLMQEAETQGKTVVATEEKEQAELHVADLHGFGLQATIGKVV